MYPLAHLLVLQKPTVSDGLLWPWWTVALVLQVPKLAARQTLVLGFGNLGDPAKLLLSRGVDLAAIWVYGDGAEASPSAIHFCGWWSCWCCWC